MTRIQCYPTYEQLESLTDKQLADLTLATNMIRMNGVESRERMLANFKLKLKFDHPIYKFIKH